MPKRRATLAVAGLTLGCALPAAAPAGAASARHDSTERSVVRKVNAIRAQHGLRRLRRSHGLARAADSKAREVVRTDVLSHASSDGTPMQRRVRRFVDARAIGETLGLVSRGGSQAEKIVGAWMSSPSHRAALLSPAFRRVGVGRPPGRGRGVPGLRLRPRPGERPVDPRDVALPAAAAAAGGAIYVALDPPSADLAAQLFRVELAERAGATLFSTAWFGGHHTPAYSVLFPPLGGLVGAQVAGALSGVVASGAVGALAGRRAGLWFVPGMLATLVSGRLTFALGVAAGATAVLAAARGRTALAAVGGVLTALCSPVAALFAALVGGALLLGGGRRAGLALGAGAGLATLALVVAFPEGGTFPFVASAFWPALAFGVGVALAAPPGPVRAGGALYALLCLAAFLVPSPVGGNATRLGALLAAPLAVGLLWPHRRPALALLALPLAYWVVQPAVRDVRRAHDDPSRHATFHAPLLAFLARREERPVRIEVPLTRSHGEARHVAARFPLARGWQRQLDRGRNALFYDGRLTGARYRRWLSENAVAYVAVPRGIPLDASGEVEARLVARRPPYLREVARLPTYVVFAVRDPEPLGAERMRADGFAVRASGRVRIRYTPYWTVVRGRGCVGPAPGGWTSVRVLAPGPVEVGTRFSPGRVRASASRCR